DPPSDHRSPASDPASKTESGVLKVAGGRPSAAKDRARHRRPKAERAAPLEPPLRGVRREPSASPFGTPGIRAASALEDGAYCFDAHYHLLVPVASKDLRILATPRPTNPVTRRPRPADLGRRPDRRAHLARLR